MEKVFLAVLQMTSGIGNAKIRDLLDYFGSAKAVWQASESEIIESKCLSLSVCEQLFDHRKQCMEVDAFAQKWDRQGIKLCSCFEEEYPRCLKEIFNPPMILYYCGDFSCCDKNIAIVGARKASAYGKSAAELLARDLAKAGAAVISGAARGIDTAAHQGALAAAGKTIAVLGCGVDIAYPPENRKLLAQIVEQGGAIVSEFAPGMAPLAKNFPARNRIISGLSDGVVVVEAAVKSGSLITAEFALAEGRDVFAVPGSIFSPMSSGCHDLIKQGAKLVEGAKDILAEYTMQYSSNKKNMVSLSDEEETVYQVLREDKPLTIEEIILKTRSDVSNVAFVVLQLELRGLIKEYAPHRYVRAVEEGVM